MRRLVEWLQPYMKDLIDALEHYFHGESDPRFTWMKSTIGTNTLLYLRRRDRIFVGCVMIHENGRSVSAMIAPDGDVSCSKSSPRYIVYGHQEPDDVYVGCRSQAERMARLWVERTIKGVHDGCDVGALEDRPGRA
jgi:hypothetical protein